MIESDDASMAMELIENVLYDARVEVRDAGLWGVNVMERMNDVLARAFILREINDNAALDPAIRSSLQDMVKSAAE
jgi:hypothetical protein